MTWSTIPLLVKGVGALVVLLLVVHGAFGRRMSMRARMMLTGTTSALVLFIVAWAGDLVQHTTEGWWSAVGAVLSWAALVLFVLALWGIYHFRRKGRPGPSAGDRG